MKRLVTTYTTILTLIILSITTVNAQDCSSAQECYQKAQSLGTTEEALTYLIKAESLWTEADGKEKMLWILKARGNNYFALKNYPKAIQDYNKVIQLNPESIYDLSDAFFSRGNVMGASGNHQGAIQSYDKAIEIAPPKMIAVLNKALSYKNAGMEAECIANYKLAAELGSNKAISFLYYDYKTDHREAQKAALAADAGWQKIEKLKTEGARLIDSGDRQGALKAYQEAEELLNQRGDSENVPSVIAEQAYIFRLNKNYDAAISNASRAAYCSFPAETAFVELGYALYESGNQMGGVEACQRGLQKFPKSTSIPSAISWMYSTSASGFFNKQDYITAYELYFKAYEANNDATAAHNAAKAAYAGKIYEQSLNAYYIAVGLDPSLQTQAKPYIDYLKTVVK